MKTTSEIALKLIDLFNNAVPILQSEFITMVMINYPKTVKHAKGGITDLIGTLTVGECFTCLYWLERRV
jgi:hypothetical protein